MSIFASHEEKALKALEQAAGRRSYASADLDAHQLAPADPGDFDAIRAWQSKETDLARDLEIAEGVVRHWEGVVAKHEAEAAAKAADAEHAAVTRSARETEKLVRDIAADAAKLAAKRDRLAEHIKMVDEYNARRGNRPFIVDAERSIREVPGQIFEPEFRDEVVWEDGAGNRPSVYRETPDGEIIPRDAGYVKKSTRVQVRAERVEPARAPDSFVSALRLVDLQGKPL